MVEPITATIGGAIVLGACGNALYEVAKGTGQIAIETFSPSRRLYESLTQQQQKRLMSRLAEPVERYRLDGLEVSLEAVGRALLTVVQSDVQLATGIQTLTAEMQALLPLVQAGVDKLKVGQVNILTQTAAIRADVARLLTRPDTEAMEFEQTYCQAVRDRLDRVELFGVDPVDSLARRQSLSVAYISLSVDVQAFHQRKKPLDADEFHLDRHLFAHESQAVNANEVLRLSPRIVIRGRAGSGKTTMLQWIAVRAACGDFPPALADWNDCVPFFIRLREWVEQGLPTPEKFPEKINEMLVGDMPSRDWVHNLLERGRALVLIDGVDELPFAQRPQMLDLLEKLVQAYPLPRYVVTSRPAAINAQDWPDWQQWTDEQKFVTGTLEDMDARQIEAFIDRWHEALAVTLTDSVERQEVTEELPSNLKRLLSNRPPLRNLAINPLLCAMVCALHRTRGEHLPSERLELYGACVEMLLSLRESKKEVVTGEEYPNLDKVQMRRLVRSFALWLQENEYSAVKVETADDRFHRQLTFMNLPDETGERVRRFLVERTNLLQESGLVDFTHKTFLEYLAAEAAVEENKFGVLAQKALDDNWQEIIVLAVGKARPYERDEMVGKLIEKGQAAEDEAARRQYFLLALACLETSTDYLNPDVRQRVLSHAVDFIPPEDDEQIQRIAMAGRPAVELLTYRKAYSEREAARCILPRRYGRQWPPRNTDN